MVLRNSAHIPAGGTQPVKTYPVGLLVLRNCDGALRARVFGGRVKTHENCLVGLVGVAKNGRRITLASFWLAP